MATWNDLIKNSLRLLRVKEAGETLDANESADGLEAVNNLLDSWSNERWMQTHIAEVTVTLTAGDGEYTIGNTGDFQAPEALVCGSLDLEYQYANKWTGINSGQFGLNVGGYGIRNITCDFATVTTMAEVASTIQDEIVIAGAGTITMTAGSPLITGSSSKFVEQLSANATITYVDDVSATKTATISSISTNTALAFVDNAPSNATNVTYTITSPVTVTCSYDEDQRRFKFSTSSNSESFSYLTGGDGGTNIASILKGLESQAENNTDTNLWPVKIESAFIKDSSGNDYTLYPMTDEQYSRVGLKTTQSSYGNYYYYRRSYPYGKIVLWDVPSTASTLHLRVWPQWTQATSGTATVSLPPGYERAIIYNLAVEISPEYADASMIVQQKAIESKSWIKTVNTVVPIMRSPARNVTGRNNRFDYNTGGYTY